MALKAEEIAKVKAQGFLLNKGTECFSGRVLPKGAVFSAEDLTAISECAQRFGNGKVAFTSRLTAEIVGIPFEKIPEAQAFMAERGLYFGGTGAKIRPVTACKGTTCIYGNCDTQGLAAEIHDKYYVGWGDVKLPHKFKIGVGGCPNSCMKPSLNDFGIEGHRVPIYDADKCRGCKVCQVDKYCPSKATQMVDGKLVILKDKCLTCGVCSEKCPFDAVLRHDHEMYQIYVGGTWGKTYRMGTKLSRLVEKEEIFPILEKTMVWFKENAQGKERLGKVLDRLGEEKLEEYLFSDTPVEKPAE